LPMLYMDDAIRATSAFMRANEEKISIRTSYNLNALSFTPKELAEVIKKQMPSFEISYQPDFRQTIADSWSASIDDSLAQKDWNWKPAFDIEKMTIEMLKNLKEKLMIN